VPHMSPHRLSLYITQAAPVVAIPSNLLHISTQNEKRMYSRILTLFALAAHSSAACTRAALQEAVTAYLAAQGTGNLNLLHGAENTSYTENDVMVDMKRGIIGQAVTFDLSRSLLDTENCATFTEISAATNRHPYVIDTRMLVSGTKVTAIETVVADAGDWVFNATSQLYWSRKENWTTIPESMRNTRANIKAAGDAYLDSWADGTVKVPYGTPCARLEGGAYTGEHNATTNTCRMPEFPKPFVGALNRRYVVDEEVGAVGIFNNFPFIDATRPEGTPSTNLIRVQGGQIRYIHETTICATRNCGR
jgi:hypothetical protein